MNSIINEDSSTQDRDPQSDHSSDYLPHSQQQPHPQPRRPRGFAAAATTNSAGKGKKEREKEKERTKLRERHRRAITSRMLAGLRQYGNFPLPARADINNVLAAHNTGSDSDELLCVIKNLAAKPFNIDPLKELVRRPLS